MTDTGYTALDQSERREFGNGLTMRWAYHGLMQWLKQLKVGTSSNYGNVLRRSYTYDLNGNRVSGGRSYTWNADNQPGSITGADAIVETYSYDADGERVTRRREGVTTVYIGGLWEEHGSAETRALYTVNGQAIAQRSITGADDTLVYLHADHLGSVSVVTAAAGAVVSRQDYTPWGDVRGTDSTTTSLDYTGQRRDDTGLLYYHSRFYDPTLGRFVSADVIAPDRVVPQTRNRS